MRRPRSRPSLQRVRREVDRGRGDGGGGPVGGEMVQLVVKWYRWLRGSLVQKWSPNRVY